MKKKMAIALSSIAIAGTIANIGAVIYVLNKVNKYSNDIRKQLDAFKFSLANPEDPQYKINIAEHLASEYTYANYYYYETYESSKEPTLRNTDESEKNYWRAQLESKVEKNWLKNDDLSPQAFLRNQLFSLINNKMQRIDKFYNDYNIFYHSHANDFTGTLYLTVSLEHKSDEKNKDGKTKNISERINKWISKTYVLNGFKKITEKEVYESSINPVNVPHSWRMEVNEKLRQTFYKKEKKTVDELFNSLPREDLSSDFNSNKARIAENYAEIKKFFNIPEELNKKTNNPEYKIDTKRGLWFTKGTDTSLILNFYAYKIVPEAEAPKNDNDRTSLIKSRKIDLQKPFKQEINIKYFELEKIIKDNVEIKVIGNDQINHIDFKTPATSLEWVINSSENSGVYKNASRGYYKRIQLDFKISFKDSSLYELFYCTKQIEDYSKEKDKYKGEPLVKFDELTGEATFYVGIKAKSPDKRYESYNTNPEFIGEVKLTGFKKT
ncbi:hypothetical protein NPA07_04585 [Mycoplasmopsis caviae]|uniref:Uncharacterized protein n=1 Tax=Mycoplasmopsis caviae TaxID=55603 RepID=A0A3P8MDQ7_9BACT|nr:hypothetical protein [Mycoplasmopsis caviae]UUD35054.1 hypothetical protein NPA07_04585 [Mycoplasmopsis caviae]VDR42120.1 Uncharacterised protein [Mycoplasmopsis caviae]